MSASPTTPSSEKDLKVGQPSSVSDMIITAEDEKRILRKLDLNGVYWAMVHSGSEADTCIAVLPILSLLYLWSFLDVRLSRPMAVAKVEKADRTLPYLIMFSVLTLAMLFWEGE